MSETRRRSGRTTNQAKRPAAAAQSRMRKARTAPSSKRSRSIPKVAMKKTAKPIPSVTATPWINWRTRHRRLTPRTISSNWCSVFRVFAHRCIVILLATAC